MPPFLITQRGPVIGHRHDLDSSQFTIGRGQDNDLVLNDALVSRYHAVIRQESAGLVLIDLGSTNPALVNDVPLEPGVPQRLQHRDVVVIGAAVFSFQNPTAPQVQPVASRPAPEPRTVIGRGPAAPAEPPPPPLAVEPPPTARPRVSAADFPPLDDETPTPVPFATAERIPPPPLASAPPPRVPEPPLAVEPPPPPPLAVERPPLAAAAATPPARIPEPPPLAPEPAPPVPPPPPLASEPPPPPPFPPSEARTVISRRGDGGSADALQTPGRLDSRPDDETPTVIRRPSPDA